MIRGLTLDTGALIALERGDRRVRALLTAAAEQQRPVTIPAPVIAEAWRGGGFWLSRLLNDAAVEPTDLALAKAAGEMLARTATTQVVDAIVTVSAARRGDAILTSDPTDLHRLADDFPGLRVLPV